MTRGNEDPRTKRKDGEPGGPWMSSDYSVLLGLLGYLDGAERLRRKL